MFLILDTNINDLFLFSVFLVTLTVVGALSGLLCAIVVKRSRFLEKSIKIIYFEDIVRELVEITEVKGSYDSMVLQIIRMLKLISPRSWYSPSLSRNMPLMCNIPDNILSTPSYLADLFFRKD
jgi:hypothetical protein